MEVRAPGGARRQVRRQGYVRVPVSRPIYGSRLMTSYLLVRRYRDGPTRRYPSAADGNGGVLEVSPPVPCNFLARLTVLAELSGSSFVRRTSPRSRPICTSSGQTSFKVESPSRTSRSPKKYDWEATSAFSLRKFSHSCRRADKRSCFCAVFRRDGSRPPHAIVAAIRKAKDPGDEAQYGEFAGRVLSTNEGIS